MDAIESEGWRLTTGFVGVGYLLPVLSAHGHTGVAYRLLEQDALPSWRYMVEQGATTIWERWDGWTAERGFQSPLMNSFNHYALGAVGEWLYRFVLGIEPAPDAAGFGRLLIRPHPGRLADLGARFLPVGSRADYQRVAAGRRFLRPAGRAAPERHGERARAQRRSRSGPGQRWPAPGGHRRLPRRCRGTGSRIRGRIRIS